MHRPHPSRVSRRPQGSCRLPAVGAIALACGAALMSLSGAFGQAQDTRLVLYSEFTSVPARQHRAIPVMVVPEGPKVEGVSKPDSPKIDGDLTDAAWGKCPVAELDSEMGTTPAAGEKVRQTTVRVCRDDENLYVAFLCREPAIGDVPVGAEPLPDALCAENVCVYVSSPDAAGDYFVLGVDPNGARYDASLLAGTAWSSEWDVKCQRTPDGWTAEMAIPLKALGVKRTLERESWRVNFTRNIAATGGRLAWEPTFGNAANADRWGMLCFGETDVTKRTAPPPRISLYPDRWVVNAGESILRVVARTDNLGGDAAPKYRLRLTALTEGRPDPAASSVLPMRAERAYLVVGVDALPIGAFDLQAELLDAAGAVAAKSKISLKRLSATATPVPPGRAEIQIPAYGFKSRVARTWPINTGVALPKGAIFSASNCRMVDASGTEIPCAAQVRARWPADGSVRWLGVEFGADLTRAQAQSVFLDYGPAIVRAPCKGFTTEVQKNQYEALNMYLMEMEDAWWINTGSILFNIKKRFAGIEDVAVDANRNGIYDWTEQILGMPAKRAGGPYLVDQTGRTYRLAADRNLKIQVENFHERRIVLRGEGRLVPTDGDASESVGDCVFRLFAYAGQPFVHLQVTFMLDGPMLLGRVADLGFSERLDTDMLKQKCEAFFGIPESPRHRLSDGGGAFILRMKDDDYVIRNLKGPITLDKSGKGAMDWAGVAGPDRGVAVCLRNMGALHPKEMEFSSDGRLVTHFWPAHGDDALRAMPGEVNSRNVGLLGFAHYGRVLNLKAPAEFAGGIKERSTLPDFDGVRTIDLAEPGGMALTYDLMYLFFRGDPDMAEIAEVSRIFERQPHAVQSHASLASSGVLVDMLPPARAERAAKLADRLLAVDAMRGAATGDFNYMDLRRGWLPVDGRWSLANYWMGTRADVGAALWTLYMQTGRPELFRAAAENLRHTISVDLCRNATPEDLLQADPRRRKIAGAFGDHGTPVHWQGAWHVSDRYARVRSLLLAYYLTGDSLARDSAFAWADAARRHGIPYSGIDGMAFLDNLSDVLSQTYDPILQDRMGECADFHFRMPCVAPATEVWAPGVRAYAQATGDPRAVRYLENAAGSIPRDHLHLLGLTRDIEALTGQGTAGPQSQPIVGAFEQRVDGLLGKPASPNDAVSWQELSAYVFGATEQAKRFAPKTPPAPAPLPPPPPPATDAAAGK